MQPVRYLGSSVTGKSRGSKKMFSTSVMRGEILRRSGMKLKEQKNTGKQTGGFRKVVKKVKGDWIGAECEEIKTCLNKNSSKTAYQLVEDLTSEKQGRSLTIQDKSGKCLTEKQEILSRWIEHFPEPHNYETCGDNAVLDCSQPVENVQPILLEEVKIAAASLKKGKPAGVVIYKKTLFKLAGRP